MTRPPTHRRRTTGLLVAGLALLTVTAVGVDRALDAQAEARNAPALAVVGTGTGGLEGSLVAAQERLEDLPGDWRTWAQLGVSYVEQARVTGDASFYQRADRALAESLSLRPDDNDIALVGLGALANARHDFSAAAEHAEAALALNPASSTAYAVLTDARVQLGEYDAATAAAQRLLDLRPTLPALARGSYDRQLHGDMDQARSLMERALQVADEPGETAFALTHLAEIALRTGDLEASRAHAEAGLAAVADDPGLLAALARVEGAEGDEERAIELWEQVVAARPLPEHLAEFATYLVAVGRDDDAAEQFEVYELVQDLFANNGVADDLTGAYLAADRGDVAAAVAHAEAERRLRRNVDSADALAWALHVAGRDEEALPLAVEATALGRDASFLYHRGMIEAALGDRVAAVTSLRAALATNPWFSPLHGPRAAAALAELESR